MRRPLRQPTYAAALRPTTPLARSRNSASVSSFLLFSECALTAAVILSASSSRDLHADLLQPQVDRIDAAALAHHHLGGRLADELQRTGNSSVAYFSPQFLNQLAMMPDSIW